MANYIVTDEELTGIADAIRAKSNWNNQIVFPNGFLSSIAAIKNKVSLSTYKAFGFVFFETSARDIAAGSIIATIEASNGYYISPNFSGVTFTWNNNTDSGFTLSDPTTKTINGVTVLDTMKIKTTVQRHLNRTQTYYLMVNVQCISVELTT